ncbi:hypothetical protein CDAR_74401 [Caerostris darwini]|uniref:Uncharacterized protein n=1 Tax=Caerostris darwini TaxID=1538125 RepID=A0AAV4UK29_9ARAC|nr:hypothetical protein CDAR_74401 [Caerostris darwini]
MVRNCPRAEEEVLPLRTQRKLHDTANEKIPGISLHQSEEPSSFSPQSIQQGTPWTKAEVLALRTQGKLHEIANEKISGIYLHQSEEPSFILPKSIQRGAMKPFLLSITKGHGELQANIESCCCVCIAFHLEHDLQSLQLPPCRASTMIPTNSRSSTPKYLPHSSPPLLLCSCKCFDSCP